MEEKVKKKRNLSDNSVNNETPTGKREKHGDSPDDVHVSTVLSQANSVLYETAEIINLEGTFRHVLETDGLSQTSYIGQVSEISEMSQVEGPTNADLMKCLNGIDTRLMGMDERLKKLETLEHKVEQFEAEMKKMWTYVYDTSKRTGEKLSDVTDKVESTDFALGVVNEKVLEIEREKDLLKEEVVYLQSQSMRNNLVFGNITEAQTEVPEDTEKIVREFMVEKMKIARKLVDDMQFERVHRMGQKLMREGKHRNIVAKFTLFKEREYVRKQWKALRGTDYFVYEQFPKEVNDRRKKLIPRMKAEKQKGNRAWIAYDTLYVNGRPVKDSSEK